MPGRRAPQDITKVADQQWGEQWTHKPTIFADSSGSSRWLLNILIVFHSVDPSILQLKVKQSEPRAFHANLEELLSVATAQRNHVSACSPHLLASSSSAQFRSGLRPIVLYMAMRSMTRLSMKSPPGGKFFLGTGWSALSAIGIDLGDLWSSFHGFHGPCQVIYKEFLGLHG
jgi:hypothetical protein